MELGPFLDSTWIGSWHQSQGGEDLIIRFSPIGTADVNIVGHSTGTAETQIEGNVLFVTINRHDGLVQAFTCAYTDTTRNELRGFYLHYNANPISKTPMNLRRFVPVVQAEAVKTEC